MDASNPGDNEKEDLLEWVGWNYRILVKHCLICPGGAGRLVEEAIKGRLKREREKDDFEIFMLKSGPLEGDRQF